MGIESIFAHLVRQWRDADNLPVPHHCSAGRRGAYRYGVVGLFAACCRTSGNHNQEQRCKCFHAERPLGLRMNISTCGILGIKFDMNQWEDAVETEGQFISYIHPEHDLHEHS